MDMLILFNYDLVTTPLFKVNFLLFHFSMNYIIQFCTNYAFLSTILKIVSFSGEIELNECVIYMCMTCLVSQNLVFFLQFFCRQRLKQYNFLIPSLLYPISEDLRPRNTVAMSMKGQSIYLKGIVHPKIHIYFAIYSLSIDSIHSVDQ